MRELRALEAQGLEVLSRIDWSLVRDSTFTVNDAALTVSAPAEPVMVALPVICDVRPTASLVRRETRAVVDAIAGNGFEQRSTCPESRSRSAPGMSVAAGDVEREQRRRRVAEEPE